MAHALIARRWIQSILLAASLLASLGAAAQTPGPPFVVLNLAPTTVPFGGGNFATLDIFIGEPSNTGFTNASISFTYPNGVVNSPFGTISNGCGGTLIAAPNTGQMTLTSGSNGSGGCSIDLPITAAVPGTYSIVFPANGFSASDGTNAASNAVSLTVTPPAIVTNTADSGIGSLRDAITIANQNCGQTNVVFSITGAPPFVIKPLTALPPVQCSYTIDGYTESGSVPNSDASGLQNNATIQIELDGSALFTTCSTCDGLLVQGNSTVRGLAIHSFGGAGINVTGGTGSIFGNYIGTDATGMNAPGNLLAGVFVTGFADVGQSSVAADANLISGNGVGILVQGSGVASIASNLIGGKRDGSPGNGNLQEGVYFQGVTGSPSTVTGNTIRYNGEAGIATGFVSSGQVFIGNASYANTKNGIDVADDGPSLNDEASVPYDTDGVQNYPVITSVVHSGANTIVSGYIKTQRVVQEIELYHNSVMDAKTEGEKLLDIFSVTLDGTGFASFTRTIPNFLADNMTATAVTSTCSTACSQVFRSSEYSPKVAVSNPLVVTNTADSGPGSLRDAITFVNSNCASQIITFNIPGTGIQTIIPATPLPPLVCAGSMINGETQPGARQNSLAVGSDAQLLIEIDGRAASGANGLEIGATDVIVRGLIIDDFGAQSAIFVNAPAGSNVQVHGNILGDPTGTRAKKNSIGVFNQSNTASLIIGSGAPADRNVISGNDIGVWLQGGAGTVVQNNYIGTDAGGTLASGNDSGLVANAAVNGLVLLDNVVAANLGDGINVFATGSVVLLGNFIGINQIGTGGLGNGSNGIRVSNPAIIGDTSLGNGNTIAFNGTNGITVGTQGVRIRGNSIFANGATSFGIDLTGVPPSIDHCDADSGANGLQNYPAIASAVLGGGNLTISGALDSVDLATYTLDFYANLSSDNASNRGGRTFVGTVTATTGSAGPCSTSWTLTVPYVGAVGDLITGTATDSSDNTSWFSAAVAVTAAPVATAPGAPVIGTATAGNTTATVSFSPPASDGGSPITGYTVTSNPGFIAATGTTSPITVGGLANGTTYTFTVTATNAVGTSPPSAPSNAVTPVAPPGSPSAPFIGTASAGNAQATVTFSPPASNGGSAITSYTVSSSPGGVTATGPGSPITVTGLANGTAYTFTVVATNGVGTGPASASSNAVTPTAPVPVITLTPPSLTFATRPVSTSSPPQTVTITNNGPGNLVITSISVSGDFSFASACGASIAPGATCTVDVTFTPLTAGARTGSVTIASNASGSPHTISLSGTGQSSAAPVIQVDPSSGDFAPQEVGTTSDPMLFAIVNAGSTTLVFSTISVSGAGFTLLPTVTGTTYERCGPALASGSVCAVQVTFGASVPGTFTGTLQIAGNATNSPVDVSLSASAVVGTPARVLSMPSSLNFPDQAVGTVSAGRALDITNTSGAAVSVSELDATGDFSVSDTCATIAAHATCSPLVSFQPAAVGPRTGTLTVRASSEAAPYAVTLNGNGVVSTVPQIALSVTRVGFGNTLMGVPVAMQVLVNNVGLVPVTIESIVASGDYFVAHSCGISIAVGASCTINVSFYPRMIGSRDGGVTIRTNAAGSPHLVQLSGVGCALPTLTRARFGLLVCGP